MASQRQRYRFDSSEIFLLGKLVSIALRVPFVNRVIKLNNRAVTISMLESNWFCISFVTRLALKNHATFFIQSENQNQSYLTHGRFPALYDIYI